MPKKHRSKKGGRPHSSLKQHRLERKVLIPPLKTIPNIQFYSWMNDRLPEVLWAALLAGSLPRDKYLPLFRAVSNTGAKFRNTKVFITHSALAEVSESDFATIMESVIGHDAARAALGPLRLFATLPDLAHWVRCAPEPDPVTAWEQLATGIAGCLFHQSEASTDVRWLKVRFPIIQHRMVFPENMRYLAEEIIDFPNRGEMRAVRPSIRAMEGATGTPEMVRTSDWPERFWHECMKSTPCIAISRSRPDSAFPHDVVNECWGRVYAECAQHCVATAKTTAIDTRHDGVFGLALYGLCLVASLFRPQSTRPSGRLVLRALVETYLTLAFLVKKDEESLWKAYRVYGGGQAKLAFLKLIEGDNLPRYVDIETLETLSNEDVWQEFLNIDLGHWADKDLRRMSEEVGVKHIYDKYYAWPSAFVHAQWAAVRNTVFDQCFNPLHRLHRIPRPPRLDLEDVSWDGAKLGNLILDLVNEAYPTFKPRLRVPKIEKRPEADEESRGTEKPTSGTK